jgi:hypothetical protein
MTAAIDVQQGHLQTIRVSRYANSWFSDATSLHLGLMPPALIFWPSTGHLHPYIRSDSSDSSANWWDVWQGGSCMICATNLVARNSSLMSSLVSSPIMYVVYYAVHYVVFMLFEVNRLGTYRETDWPSDGRKPCISLGQPAHPHRRPPSKT